LSSPQSTLFIELNEVNFNYVERYVRNGKLPVIGSFIERHGVQQTSSQTNYEELEPWIQWVTAHTGLTLEEHGVFRLGDIVGRDIDQIWEQLERTGLKVGAVSPMNAACRMKNPAFFIPDPWTETSIVAPATIQRLYGAVTQVVKDNAQGRMTRRSKLNLILGGLIWASPQLYGRYLEYALKARRKPWLKAIFLDLLLSDIFSTLVRRTRPDFATLFLNAAAHIQHHYMFSSTVYDGAMKNPSWYIDKAYDPVLEVYELYDLILERLLAIFPDHRIMIATGLHQDPYPAVTYYWRLKNHADFLRKIGVPFLNVEPRMSRDFLIICKSNEQAQEAERLLNETTARDGVPLFEVDNRGANLFVMLTYPNDISKEFHYKQGNKQYYCLENDVAFVAIKNGEHNGTGYFSDSKAVKQTILDTIPLTSLYKYVYSEMTHNYSACNWNSG
jgi:hypothetical protein